MVGRNRRDNPYFRLLLASFCTSWLAANCFSTGIYFGSVFGPDWAMLQSNGFFWVALLIVPAFIFALFAVWPVALFSSRYVRRIEHRFPSRWSWPIWLGAGSVIGAPALFFYSFPLGLGQALLGDLLATGAALGMACAALSRWLLGAEILDATSPVEAEYS